MNNVYRLSAVFLVVIQCLAIIGCGTTDGAGSPSMPDASPPPGATPTEPAPDGGAIGSDIGDTVSKDLSNTVDNVKGRDFSLPRRGIFFSAGVRNLERTSDTGDVRIGNDSDITNLVVGYDQIISDSWIVGSLVDLSRREDFSSSDQVEFESSNDSLSLFLFSSVALNESVDLSGYAGFGRSDTSSQRITESGTIRFLDQASNMIQTLQVEEGEAQGDSNSSIVSAGLSVSRRTVFAKRNHLILGVEADFFQITTDAFTEQGSTNTELAYRENTRENMIWTLSTGLSRTYSSSVGVFVPTITLAYVRENPDDDAIVADLVFSPTRTALIEAAPTDNSYGKVDLDIVLVRPGGIQLFGNLNSNFENSIEDSSGVNVGARLEF